MKIDDFARSGDPMLVWRRQAPSARRNADVYPSDETEDVIPGNTSGKKLLMYARTVIFGGCVQMARRRRLSTFRTSWTRSLRLCDCSHRSAFSSAPWADCPRPRATSRGRNSGSGPDHSPGACLGAYHRPNRRCASGDATPSTDHPDRSEDSGGSTSAVP